ncbi:MAG: T9SS type A sorting domain-containing protein [Candidatus Eisenbacteria bacterium]|uniref:T9SS type A sorting domain-containing protein n=1 Tax=Eiseniibacteriota bacterium TaxID=2212470 RepID=A0A849SET6_UNCEI|nr:T9SS type A sorting domain-containing protein [Candidatus Eisenbacteria bacterium]
MRLSSSSRFARPSVPSWKWMRVPRAALTLLGVSLLLPVLAAAGSPDAARLDAFLNGFSSRTTPAPDGRSVVLSQPNTPQVTAFAHTLVSGWPRESNVALRRFGLRVCTAGDVNGDGWSDVLTYGGKDVLPADGQLALYLGTGSGTSTTPIWVRTGIPINLEIAPAGDVNNDGLADIVIGQPTALSGSIQIMYGRGWGLDTVNITVVARSINGFGGAVAPAGDVNGDGFDDVIVGAPSGVRPGSACAVVAGYAEVLFGSGTGLDGSNRWWVNGCDLNYPAASQLGAAVASAGDVNADGFGDVAVGIPGYQQGHVVIWYGSGTADGLPQPPSSTFSFLVGDESGARFGAALAPAGDVNADGYADLLVGAPNHDSGGDPDRGAAYLYPGTSTTLSTTAFWAAGGPSPIGGNNAHFGAAVASAGDVNGDGLGDVIIGAPNYSNGQSNEGAWVVYTSLGFTMASDLGAVESGEVGAQLGTSVCTAGDSDGDGFGDWIVSAPYHSNGQAEEGQVFVWRGGADLLAAAPWFTYSTFQSGASYGWSVASAGDVNGDGYDDIIVGAPFFTNTLNAEGGAFVVRGGPTGPLGVVDWQAYGGQASAQLGVCVSKAGDVNGDGYDDIIAGADQYDGTGTAWVYYGSSSGLTGSPHPRTQLFGSGDPGAHFGNRVAAAGDVNGDGFADVIVGAVLENHGENDEGRAYVFLGSAAGIQTTPQLTLEGNQESGQFGGSVASAGDVNGDGYSDIVIGAPQFDSPIGPFFLVDSGQAWVFPGTASGVSSTPLRVYLGDDDFGSLGSAVSSAGDVNRDGLSDVVIGAYGRNNCGAVFVFPGVPGSISATPYFTFQSSEVGSAFGSAVSTAGDMNGDGYSDIVVGAVFADNLGPQDQGTASVFLGGPLTMSGPVTRSGGESFANFGGSVAGGMDMNGDGFGDLLIGAPGDDVFGFNDGTATGFLGSTTAITRRIVLLNGGVTEVLPSQGMNDNTNRVYLYHRLRSAGGRLRVRMEWRLNPTATLAANASVLSGLTTENLLGTPIPGEGAVSAALVPVNGLQRATCYGWRSRVRSRSPYWPTEPWQSPQANGWFETDFRNSSMTVGVEPVAMVTQIELAAPSPNPTRETSRIAFALPTAGRVRLAVYDVQGREVAQLADGLLAAGRHEMTWNGRDRDGRATRAGVYFYRLETGGRIMTQRAVRLD